MEIDNEKIGPKFYKEETKEHRRVIRLLKKQSNSKPTEYASPIRIKSVSSERK